MPEKRNHERSITTLRMIVIILFVKMGAGGGAIIIPRLQQNYHRSLVFPFFILVCANSTIRVGMFSFEV